MMAEQLELVRAPLPALRPFWRYYGGKWRAAPMYPQPMHQRIVEPFAGAAGYSLRYASHDVVLVEAYHPIAEIWRWLIAARPEEVFAIPLVEHVDDLPSWVPTPARYLVRFTLAVAQARMCNTLSQGFRKQAIEHPTWTRGWDDTQRRTVALQVPRIKHWRVIEGDYTTALELLDGATTSFWDPPYFNKAGEKYPCRPKGTKAERAAWYAQLAAHIRAVPGQVIACENEGASYLPFEKFGQFRRGLNNREGSREVVYYQVDGEQRPA